MILISLNVKNMSESTDLLCNEKSLYCSLKIPTVIDKT